MNFARPEWLNALFAVPVLAALILFGARRRRRALLEFTGGRFSEALAPGSNWRKGLLKGALRVAAFALVVTAIAGPQFGSHLVKVEREGIDLVIALDASLSMLAEDMKPNRLERAKQEIVDLVQGLRGDRVGLVVFAGDAFVLCPLTVDYDAALMLAQTADVTTVSEPGTAIGAAIEKSVSLFAEGGKADRVIILVTDGEDHEGDPVEQAKKAGDDDIRIYTIGIGNPGGELIPLRGTDGTVGGYKKDDSGETVLSRLDEGTLQRIARAAGGQYLPATREGLELKVLYREISGLEKAAIKGEFLEKKKDRFVWFLGAAFLALLLEFLLLPASRSRRGEKAKILHTGAVGAACVIASLLFASSSGAKGFDRGRVQAGNQYYRAGEYQKSLVLYDEALGDTTRIPEHAEGVLYNQANALHMLERYPEALHKYQQSLSEDTVQTGRMFYNRANTLVKMQQYSEAVESYLQALRYLPDDPDARHNLELALRMLRESEQQGERQQQDQKGSQKDRKEQRGGDQRGDEKNRESQDSTGQGENEQRADSSQAQPAGQDSSMTKPELPDSMQMMRLSREDALQLLRLLEEQEKEIQKEKRKAAFVRVPRSGKDW
jgi:Ca-activated chloride channel family protein